MLETPVLFIIFNRPDLERQVLERIREVKPKQLFVVADGPRPDRPDDLEKVNQARAIIDELVDWDCELHKNYSDTNMGCRDRVSSGITWFFEHVEEGIILEDDCLPDSSFFEFCEVMMDKYKDDESIGTISGYNFLEPDSTQFSYGISMFGGIWGWATWKNVWIKCQKKITLFDYVKIFFLIKSFKKTKRIYNIVNKIYCRMLDTWDYDFVFKKVSLGYKSIIPSSRLIVNVGFREDGTHTVQKKNIDKLFTFNNENSRFSVQTGIQYDLYYKKIYL